MHAQPLSPKHFDFTPEQLAVIDHRRGALLVTAGPGAGKTRVIVERIARLIERGDARPHQVLALTFARRAAGEMHVRLAQRLGARAGPVTVGTFHSFALGLIQRGYASLGYQAPPRVVDRRDRLELVRRALADCPPESLGPLAACAALPSGPALIADEIDRLGESPDELLAPDLRAPVRVVSSAYRRERLSAGWLDPSSMVPEAVRLLESDRDLTSRLHDRFRQILVDEYQDTDRPQERLLELLAPPDASLMVVADDDQTIYAFRGTSPRNLADFQPRRAAVRMDLTRNWRCGAQIQAAANRLIAHNSQRLEKHVSAVRTDARVEALAYSDLAAHARGLARLIDDEVRGNSRRCGDVAVLWRSIRHPLVGALAAELTRLDIPARVVGPAPDGGGLRSAVAALVSMARDGRLDSEPLARLLESELSGLDPRDVQRLTAAARRSGKPLAALIEERALTDIRLRAAAELVGGLRRVTQSGATRADELLFELWRTLPELTRAAREVDAPDIERKAAARRLVAQFQAVFQDAEAFTRANPDAGLDGFVERLELEATEPPELQLDDVRDDVVRLMTVHAAKGLEWPVVFVPALEEGYFPSAASHVAAAAPQGLLRAGPSDAGIAEERRLLYVAMTRAGERLVLSVDAEGRQPPAATSRFLAEAGLPLAEVADTGGLAGLRTPEEAESRLRRFLRDGTSLQRARSAYALAHLPREDGREWWTLIEPSAAAVPDLGEQPLHVNATDMADFRACPHRFKLAGLLRLRSPRDPERGLGVIVHEALRHFHAPDADHAFDSETLARLIDESWDADEFRYAPIAARQHRDARGFIENYLRHHARRGRALAVEQPFSMAVGGLHVHGRVDAIFPAADGVDIVDFKSGRSQLSKGEAAADMQLGIYALGFDLASELQGFGSPREALYLYLRRTGPRADGARARGAGPSERTAVRARLGRYETSIRRWELPPKSGAMALRDAQDAGDQGVVAQRSLCNFCQFRRICPDFMAVRSGV